jgi:hypothetical protein
MATTMQASTKQKATSTSGETSYGTRKAPHQEEMHADGKHVKIGAAPHHTSVHQVHNHSSTTAAAAASRHLPYYVTHMHGAKPRGNQRAQEQLPLFAKH